MDDLLQRGIAAFRAGNRDEARRLISLALQQNRNDESIWKWAYNVANDDKERIYFLKNIVRTNPQNEKAKQLLSEITGGQPVTGAVPKSQKPTPKKSNLNNMLLIAIPSVLGFCICCGFIAFIGQNLSSPEIPAREPIITQAPRGASTVIPELMLAELPSETPTVANSAPAISIPNSAGFSCIPSSTERTQGNVVNVVDGDTIDVSINGQTFRVRYIGMDTPESTTTTEPFGKEATEANRKLVGGKAVTLVKDVSETDKYGRLLRYVIAGNKFVNLELVKLGFATSATYPPDVACQSTFASAQKIAETNLVGMWAATAPSAETPVVVLPTPPTIGGGGKCHPAYPSVCIAPPPPDLDCKDVPFKRFKVLPPDPHRFDSDGDGVGCES